MLAQRMQATNTEENSSAHCVEPDFSLLPSLPQAEVQPSLLAGPGMLSLTSILMHGGLLPPTASRHGRNVQVGDPIIDVEEDEDEDEDDVAN